MPRGRKPAVKEKNEELVTVEPKISEEEEVIETRESAEIVMQIPMIEHTLETERAKELVQAEKVLYIDGPELGRWMRKSYMTVLNWVNQGRIAPDAYVNDFGELKANNAIYLIANAEALVEEVKTKGKPDIKSEVEDRKF